MTHTAPLVRCVAARAGRTASPHGRWHVQVYEEIGFDISPLLQEADYVEAIQQQQQQRTKLFIIPGISEQARRHRAAHYERSRPADTSPHMHADGLCPADSERD